MLENDTIQLLVSKMAIASPSLPPGTCLFSYPEMELYFLALEMWADPVTALIHGLWYPECPGTSEPKL